MHRRNSTVGWLTLLLALSLGIPILSEAEVFWTEDFENHLAPNWNTDADGGTPDGSNPSISADTARTGTRSVKSHYNDSCGMVFNAPGCGGYIDRGHPRANDLWIRYWVKFVNGTFNPQTGSKQFYSDGFGNARIVWHVFPNTTTLGFQVVHGTTGLLVDCAAEGGQGFAGGDTTCNFFANLAQVPLNDGAWHCAEMHAYTGTPRNYDGLVEIWIDGTKTAYKPNIIIMGPGYTGGFDYIRHYAQVGGGDRYVDDLAVGNTRIGCGATTSPSPSVPSGVSAH